MLKRLIAVTALFASLVTGFLGVVGTTPASAGRPIICCNQLGVGFDPQNQEPLVMLNAYVYGVTTGAFYTCAELGESTYTNAFGDCYWMIGPYYYYSFPILQYLAAYHLGAEFYWNATTNAYIGVYPFPWP